MSSSWNWTPPRNEGIWRHGCAWLKPFFVAAPWISLALMLAVFGLASNRIALTPGTTFNLPSAPNVGEAAVTPELVALIMPVTREASALEETVVFFNDSRYVFSDSASTSLFKNELINIATDLLKSVKKLSACTDNDAVASIVELEFPPYIDFGYYKGWLLESGESSQSFRWRMHQSQGKKEILFVETEE